MLTILRTQCTKKRNLIQSKANKSKEKYVSIDDNMYNQKKH